MIEKMIQKYMDSHQLEITTYIDEDFNLVTNTMLDSKLVSEVVTPLEDLYDAFVARMQEEGYL
jgi:hypothetical protein